MFVFHLVVLITCFIALITSYTMPIFSQNVQISIMILGIVAFIRYVIARDIKKFELIIQKAKKIENKNKDSVNVGIGRKIFAFKEEQQMIPGFCDFIVKFDDGKELILSTSKVNVIKKLTTTEDKLIIYHLDGIIIDVKDLAGE